MDEFESLDLSSEKLLKEVNKAIYAITVGGQSYKIGSRELTRADLSKLKDLRSELKSEIGQGSSDILGNVCVAEFEWR